MAEPNNHASPADARLSPRIEPLAPTQHEQRAQHATAAKPLFPPSRPERLHSYHHPIAASYSSSTGFLDRHRHPTSPSWKESEHRSPPLDHRLSDTSSFSRVLPPLSGSGFKTSVLPSIASNLPSSTSWNGLDATRESSSYRASDPRYARSQDHTVPSLSMQYTQNNRGTDSSVLASPTSDASSGASRKPAKAHVPSACLNCKRAHLACDVGRPCRRCINLGKSDTCVDVQHKKRGRPRLKDRPTSQSGVMPIRSHNLTPSPSSETGHFRTSGLSSELPYAPPASADSIVHVTGMTHGGAVHHRHASVSVSASSYPFSRPDHLRFPLDRYANLPRRSPNLHPHSQAMEQDVSAVVTVICSTDLQCLRVSQECTSLLDYHPDDMVDRSLFEFVHPADTVRLERIWSSLIDPVGVVPQSAPVSADRMLNTPPPRLMTPASGTIFVQEDMRLRQRRGMYDFYSVRLHLGGGFGVDLYQRETLDRAYIVASLLKLGNDAHHPDTSILRAPYSQEYSHSREFRTPSTKRAPSPARAEAWPVGRPQVDYTSQRNGHTDRQEQQDSPHGSRDLHSSGSSNGAYSSRTEYETSQSESSRQVSTKLERDTQTDDARQVHHATTRNLPSMSNMYPPPPTARSLLSERSSASGRDVILC